MTEQSELHKLLLSLCLGTGKAIAVGYAENTLLVLGNIYVIWLNMQNIKPGEMIDLYYIW